MSTRTDPVTLAKEPFINVTTFKRDRTAVPTPVWCAAKNGSLLVFSEADSGKVKRIRHDPHVTVAPCSFRGTPRGQAIDGRPMRFFGDSVPARFAATDIPVIFTIRPVHVVAVDATTNGRTA